MDFYGGADLVKHNKVKRAIYREIKPHLVYPSKTDGRVYVNACRRCPSPKTHSLLPQKIDTVHYAIKVRCPVLKIISWKNTENTSMTVNLRDS